jgi:hypothetical protein
MELLPRSNQPNALKEWEYRIMLEHHQELSVMQIADVIKRPYHTVLKAGKRLKIKFKKQIFVTGNEVLPDVEEYKAVYNK